MSRSRHYAGESALITGTIKDSSNVAVTTPNLTSLRIVVRNARTGTLLVDNVDCLTSPGNTYVIYDSATGGFKIAVPPAWTGVSTDTDYGEDIIVVELTWTNAKDGRTETGRTRHELVCTLIARLALCTLDDVEDVLRGRVPDADIPTVEREIDDVTAALERYCNRLFGYRENFIELFSPRGQQVTFWLQRWPVVRSSVVVLESFDSDFDLSNGHVTTVSPDSYVVFEDFGAVRNRWWRASMGDQTVQIKYTGGLARETAGLPADLRGAAGQQAAYQYQRSASMGTSAERVEGGGQVIYMEKDLLPSVKRKLAQFQRPDYVF